MLVVIILIVSSSKMNIVFSALSSINRVLTYLLCIMLNKGQHCRRDFQTFVIFSLISYILYQSSDWNYRSLGSDSKFGILQYNTMLQSATSSHIDWLQLEQALQYNSILQTGESGVCNPALAQTLL